MQKKGHYKILIFSGQTKPFSTEVKPRTLRSGEIQSESYSTKKSIIIISKTAVIHTRPFDSTFAPIKEVYFVLLFTLISIYQNRVNGQELFRPEESFSFLQWRNLVGKLLCRYEAFPNKEFSKKTSTTHCPTQLRRGCRRYRGTGRKEKGVSVTPNSYLPVSKY